jgi:hypothetical protein
MCFSQPPIWFQVGGIRDADLTRSGSLLGNTARWRCSAGELPDADGSYNRKRSDFTRPLLSHASKR